MTEPAVRRTQAERRSASRDAILRAAAHGLSIYGYSTLALEHVAAQAGYTRGALYHLFANKEELALAVVEWIAATWDAEVRQPARAEAGPLASLLSLARGHALYCRRGSAQRFDPAKVMLTLRVEFSGRDHPVGHAVAATTDELERECARLITRARRDGSVPSGPPARLCAKAFLAVLESVAIEAAGRAPHDVVLVDRAVRGVLGLDQGSPPERRLRDGRGDSGISRRP